MEVTSDSHGAAAIFSGARGSCPWGEMSARGLGGSPGCALDNDMLVPGEREDSAL